MVVDWPYIVSGVLIVVNKGIGRVASEYRHSRAKVGSLTTWWMDIQ